MGLSKNPHQLTRQILAWFDQFGRKTLPWQQDKTPYRVWISEIMLQQTQVTTVIGYYERFMQRFADVFALATAHEDEVMHLWTGLGYYTRARNLHRTAKIIAQELQGIFPSTLQELEKLPGIGRSTAGAILSIAFEKPVAILDGNVKRVLTRLHAIHSWPGEKKITEQLWQLAEAYTPAHRVADYTQAIMDLGATVCTRGQPNCPVCPLRKDCLAHSQGIEKELPLSKPSKKLPVRQTYLLILRKDENTILLEKRPPVGVWGGLWSLPEMPCSATQKQIKEYCKIQYACEVKSIRFGEKFRHTFSHFHLDIVPVDLEAHLLSNKVMATNAQIWYNTQQPQNVGLPAPIKKLLTNIGSTNAEIFY